MTYSDYAAGIIRNVLIKPIIFIIRGLFRDYFSLEFRTGRQESFFLWEHPLFTIFVLRLVYSSIRSRYMSELSRNFKRWNFVIKRINEDEIILAKRMNNSYEVTLKIKYF